MSQVSPIVATQAAWFWEVLEEDYDDELRGKVSNQSLPSKQQEPTLCNTVVRFLSFGNFKNFGIFSCLEA
eukprot:3657064-Amphidinium_carterae.1